MVPAIVTNTKSLYIKFFNCSFYLSIDMVHTTSSHQGYAADNLLE